VFVAGIFLASACRRFSGLRAVALGVGGFVVLDILSDRLGLEVDRWEIGGPATWAWLGGIAAFYRFRGESPVIEPKHGIWRSALGWTGFSLAAGLAVLIVTAQGYGPIKGLYWRTFRTPAILRAAFVEELNPKSSHAQAQRERFFEIWRSRKGSYGLRMTFSSLEGQTIGQCIATKDGSLFYVYDTT